MTHNPEPKTARGKIVWFLLSSLPGLLVILLMAGIVSLIWRKIEVKQAQIAEALKAAVKTETLAVNVVTLQLQPRMLRDKINLPGVAEAWTQLQLKGQINGRIEEVFVKEGDTVNKGQPVARIESRDYQIAVDSAKASYDLARANLARNETLRSKGISTQASLEEQQTQLRLSKAAMEDAELRLSRCLITAPMSGTVSRLDAKAGLLLSVGDNVAELLKLERLKVAVSIPETDVAAVRRLKRVDIEVQALGGETFTAPVHFLAPAPESLAHVYRLELALDNVDRRVLPGMFIRAEVVKEVREQALAVPLYAVISRNDEQFVYVEEEGFARRRTVQTGFLEGWQVLITEGLQTGDKVIIEGHRSVEDGQKVRAVKSVTNLGELLQ